MSIKRSPQPLRRLHPFILLAAFLSTFSMGLLSPILPTLAERYGGNALTVGLLFSSYSLAQFISAPILGAISDRYGRRRVMLICLGGVTVGFSIFAIGGALWVLFAGWIVVGAMDGMMGIAFSYIADTTNKSVRTRYFGFLSAAVGAGFIVGPAISGVFSRISAATPLYVLLALVFLAVIWGYFSMPESLPVSQRLTVLQFSQVKPISQSIDILRFGQLRLLLFSLLLFWMMVIVLPSNLPSLVSDRLNWNPEQIAPLLAIFGIVDVTVQIGVLPLLLRRFKEIHLAIAGALTAGLAFFLLSLFPITGSLSITLWCNSDV